MNTPTKRTEALNVAVAAAGSQVRLAALLGVKQAHVWKWLNTSRDGVPAKYCPTIERLFPGKVRCEDLRPDVDWAYLRGTAASNPGKIA